MTKSVPEVLIELRCSAISGVGVFAVKPIQKGRKIAEGLAEREFDSLIPWTKWGKFDKATQEKIWDFCIGTPDGFVPPENMDFNKLSIEWYFNHSCDGNVGFDADGDFVAIRNIRACKELTYDYGLAESNPGFTMRCNCGSKGCRGTITGSDWKDIRFRKKRIANMHPRLRRSKYESRGRNKRLRGQL